LGDDHIDRLFATTAPGALVLDAACGTGSISPSSSLPTAG